MTMVGVAVLFAKYTNSDMIVALLRSKTIQVVEMDEILSRTDAECARDP